MACGAEEQHQIVCVSATLSAVTNATPTCTVTVTYQTASVEWGFSDPQTLTATGNITGAWNFTMSTATASSTTITVATAKLVVNTSYTSTVALNFGAVISNQYLGGTPSYVLPVTVPKRPAAVPTAPSISVGNITQTTALITIAAPSSNGGAAIDQYTTQISAVSNFATLHDSWTTTGVGNIGTTDLIPGTTYYTRVRAHNSAGFSPYSATASFTTLAGAQVKVAGAWRQATGYVKVNGAWVKCTGVWKKASGAWTK